MKQFLTEYRNVLDGGARYAGPLLAKLKLATLPKAGTTMLIEARVQVESVGVRDGAGGEQRSLSLQITDLCLEADTERGSAAGRLYKAKG